MSPDDIHAVWGRVKDATRRAMERGDLGLYDELERDLFAGRALVWLIWSDRQLLGSAVTQLSLTEKSRVCTIVACSGEDAREWIGLISKIEEYAKAEGCDCVRIFGRKGWQRLLPDFKSTRIVLEKRL